jgi:hypothetical protein
MNKLALLLALIISLKPSLANQVVRTDFGPAAALNEKATILQDPTDGKRSTFFGRYTTMIQPLWTHCSRMVSAC